MRDVVFITGAFKYLTTDESERALDILLDALVKLDLDWLTHHPETPSIYKSGIRYIREEGTEEWLSIPEIMREGGGDCFPVGTQMLRDDYQLIPVEELRAGMRIWGRDRWSTIERAWYKGILPLDAIRLNNGAWVQLTTDHHVYVAVCREHEFSTAQKPCNCHMEDREIRRLRVAELQPDMVLVAPTKIPFGTEAQDPDRAYIEGLYLADGWCSHNTDFAISGKDGHPKEGQKHAVEEICDRLGIRTRWHERYLTVLDAEWALRMQQMGGHAPEKHALSLNLDEGAAASLLRGIMVDGGHNRCGSQNYRTTSRQLFVQTRVLHRMFGISCGSAFLTAEQHRGLGTHPIWSLSTREPHAKSEKLLRVKEIQRGLIAAPCYDLTTDDHYVYLPEHDVTVSNCEDLACWRCAELRFTKEDLGAQVIKTHHLIPSEDDGRPFLLYHITVQRGDGRIEDPSKQLGMGREVPIQYQSLAGLDYQVAKLAQMMLNAARKGNPVAREQVFKLCRLARQGQPAATRAVGLLQEVNTMMRRARVG